MPLGQVDRDGAELAARFGTYILPGRVDDPLRGLGEAREVERLGLGCAWISERFALKEGAVLSGAVAAITRAIRINSTSYDVLRHPIVTASSANLLQALSGGRFSLMFARAAPVYMKMLGAPPVAMERLADYIGILRRLWAGETIDHDGPAGRFPQLKLTDRYDGPPPPVYFTAMGPKSLAFAGAHCDGVLLHPFLTTAGAARSAAMVRQGAERAGRDPAGIRVIQTVLVAPDLPRDVEEAILGGRAITYFDQKVMGDMIVEINGWDPAVTAAIRSHPQIAALNGKPADQAFRKEELIEIGRLIPQSWFDEGTASGTAARCAAKLAGYLDAGVDEIVLHGAAPEDMGPLTDALRAMLAERSGHARG